MTNSDFNDVLVVGTYRSGKQIEIPIGLGDEEQVIFINAMSICSAVDLSCVIEFLVSSANDRKWNDFYLQALDRYHHLFLDNMRLGAYDAEFEILKIHTSIDRIKFGYSLIYRL